MPYQMPYQCASAADALRQQGRAGNDFTGYLKLYNHHIPRRGIDSKTPILALKEWQKKRRDYSSNGFISKRDLTSLIAWRIFGVAGAGGWMRELVPPTAPGTINNWDY